MIIAFEESSVDLTKILSAFIDDSENSFDSGKMASPFAIFLRSREKVKITHPTSIPKTNQISQTNFSIKVNFFEGTNVFLLKELKGN